MPNIEKQASYPDATDMKDKLSLQSLIHRVRPLTFVCYIVIIKVIAEISKCSDVSKIHGHTLQELDGDKNLYWPKGLQYSIAYQLPFQFLKTSWHRKIGHLILISPAAPVCPKFRLLSEY